MRRRFVSVAGLVVSAVVWLFSINAAAVDCPPPYELCCYGDWIDWYTICFECSDGANYCETRGVDTSCDAGPPCRAPYRCYNIGTKLICE